MADWEDYYEILGVNPDSSDEEIKDAYRYKVTILHPDRLMRARESVRHRAQEDLKKVNRAYEILSDPKKRQEYHSEWVKQRAKPKETFIPKPKPAVDPPYIRWDNVEQGEIKRASFILQNLGGSYSKSWFSNPDSWVRVVRWASVTTSDELPLQVEIEAKGEDWGKSYIEYIRVKLDEEETIVTVKLRTKPEPVREKVGVSNIPTPRPTPSPPVSPRRGFPTWGKWMIGIACMVALIIGGIAIFGEEEVAGIANFQVTRENEDLIASFSLVDAENRPRTADGIAYIRLYDGKGNLIYHVRVGFSKNQFSKQPKEFRWRISQETVGWIIPTKDSIAKAVMYGRTAFTHGQAVLEVSVVNNETTLTAECPHVVLYSVEEIERIIKGIYYKQAIQVLEQELNKQWPFKVGIEDYFMIGDYGWAVVKRTGNEIIFFPRKIYPWYILHSKDSGQSWDILWRGDHSPLFKVEFLSEKEVRVTTPNAVFHTRDEGKTWETRSE